MPRIRFQRDGRPLVRVTIGRGWSSYDLGLTIHQPAFRRPSFEIMTPIGGVGDWMLDLPFVSIWRMNYAAPQTVGERGTW